MWTGSKFETLAGFRKKERKKESPASMMQFPDDPGNVSDGQQASVGVIVVSSHSRYWNPQSGRKSNKVYKPGFSDAALAQCSASKARASPPLIVLAPSNECILM